MKPSIDLEDTLKGHQKVVDSIKATIMQTGRTTNNITSHLETLNKDSNRKEIQDRLETAKIVSDQMREVGREAGDIRSDVFKLKQKLNSLEPEWDTKFGMAEENGKYGPF